MRWLDGITNSMDNEFDEQALGAGDGQEAWHAAVHAAAKNWTRLNGVCFF